MDSTCRDDWKAFSPDKCHQGDQDCYFFARKDMSFIEIPSLISLHSLMKCSLATHLLVAKQHNSQKAD